MQVSDSVSNASATDVAAAASYLEWLDADSNSPINVLFKTLDGKIGGDTLPNPSAAIAFIERMSMDGMAACWASVHALDQSAIGKVKVSKADVAQYRFLALDFDNKPTNGQRCAATDDERAKVRATADAVMADLMGLGLPQPLTINSGNGCLLLFPIDLAADTDHHAMMGRLAKALAKNYAAEYCEIDTAVVQDSARILGIVGTWNRNRQEIPTEGRLAQMRSVIGDYPPRAPMSADDFLQFANAYLAEHGGDASDERADIDFDATAAPSSLMGATSEPTPQNPPPTADPSDRCKAALMRWGKAYSAKCAGAIVGQRGDEKTFQTCGHLAAARCHHGHGLTETETHTLMMSIYNPKCSEQWSADEMRVKVQSAYRNGSARAVKIVNCDDEITWRGDSLPSIDDEADEHEQTAKPIAEYPPTDLGNADAFCGRYGDDLRYVTAWGRWLVWDGRRWSADLTDKARRLAQKFVRRDMLRAAEKVSDLDQRAKYMKWASASQSSARIDAILKESASKKAIAVDDLDRNGDLFNVQNGTIDLSTSAIRPHERGDLLTKMASVNFDADAKCPKWYAFLAKIFQDADGAERSAIIKYIQQSVGYSMTADISAQCLFVLYGNGQNGKSTFLGTLLALFGDYGLVGQQSLLLDDGKYKSNSEDECNLFGCRLAACSEVNSGQRFDEAKIKRLTNIENVKIRARRLYESSFDFLATHKLWLDCNHRPIVKNDDDGIWRRIKLIPFLVAIPHHERDEHLSEKLRGELGGILNWALKGLADWRANDRKLNEPSEVSAAVAEYRRESDTFGQFLCDCIEGNCAARETVDAVFQTYLAWAKVNNINATMTKKTFGQRMREKNYQSKPIGNRRYYMGLALKGATDATAATAADLATAAADERENDPNYADHKF